MTEALRAAAVRWGRAALACSLSLVLGVWGTGAVSGAEPTAGRRAEPAAHDLALLEFTRLTLLGQDFDLEWHLPARSVPVAPGAPAPAAMLLQHGFARGCANLRGTARHLAGRGLVTLCIHADMARGAPDLAQALALAVAASLQALPAARAGVADPGPPPFGLPAAMALPAGLHALPARWVLGGHSAGGLFAASMGQALAARVPSAVAGLVLIDPVGAADLADALSAVSAAGLRPVRAVLAQPSACNAQHLALPALHRASAEARAAGRDGFVGVQLLGRATHLDAEGEDTEWLAVWACGEGRPDPTQTQTLRDLVAAWSLELLGLGAPAPVWVQPAAALLDTLLQQQRVRVLTPSGVAVP